MAVLEIKDIMEQLKTQLGDNSSDEALKLLEDVSDTFNDLETKIKGDGTDWKAKFEENDKSWRERYKERFFSGTSDGDDGASKVLDDKPDTVTNDDEQNNMSLKFEDLFTTNDGKE